jgi:two-component system CheB/CheR fusion protein
MEEYDSSNEEMKAANEELQSINEEYRSATEELETSKEELQSVNEELQTVNNDMKNKLEEISRAHQELENLMGATEIGILYLDREMRIQRFTAGVSQLFNIMPSDRGRPIRHLTHKMKYDRIADDAEQVLRGLIPMENEIQAENGDWYLMRLRPFRTTEDKIQGVVLSFVDINKLKQAEKEIMSANELLEQRVEERTKELDAANRQAIQTRDLFSGLFHLNPIPTSFTRLDDGAFIDANEAYLQYFKLKRRDLIGHSSREMHLPLDPSIRPQLVKRLRKEGILRNLELTIMTPTGEEKTVLASIQRTSIENADAMILALIDITDRVRAEHEIRMLASDLTIAEQEERRRISQILHDDLQQRIFAVKMQTSMLRDAYQRGNPESAEVDFEQLEDLLEKSISITRSLSIDLSPAVLKGEGLADALVWLAAQMREQYGLQIKIQTNGISTHFEDTLRILLFQAAREVLFNIVKHAETSDAEISISKTDDEVHITISDQGQGFDANAISNDSHASGGLMNIRHRLHLMGCDIEVQSVHGQGTRVVLHVPAAQVIS